jgi:hypothetical protein
MYKRRNKIIRALMDTFETVCLAAVFTVLATPGAAQQRIRSRPAEQSDQQLLDQFSQASAADLVARYFKGPPYPLFVIRRLIDLADPVVRPDLQDAFSRETQPLPRQSLAAALVRLRDPDAQYFDYLAAAAQDAVSSDLPYSCGSSKATTAKESTESPSELIAWARAHNIAVSDALRKAATELPGAVEALG